ncbi:MAG: hypothetical protein KQI62_19020 [Deltaproteobacteria bacterium]|nr:hypothetical protein [Deltaproteobacteria bacterium]
MADILCEYLRTKRHVALIRFTGWTQKNMIMGWTRLAAKWLIDDIREDANIFNYFTYKSKEGKRVVVESTLGHNSVALDIIFQGGECRFDTMVDQLSVKIYERYGENDIFSQQQLSIAAKAMAPVIIEAIRDARFCHPYQAATKRQLLQMKSEIQQAAKALSITPFALGGALADLLEFDTTFDIKNNYNDFGEWLWRGAGKVIREGHEVIGELLSQARNLASQINPSIARGLLYAEMAWAIVPKQDIQLLTESITRESYKLVSYLLRECHLAVIKTRDDFVDIQTTFDFKRLAEAAQRHPEKFEEYKTAIKAIVIKDTPPETIKNFIIFYHISKNKNVINNALQIADKIDELDESPDSRQRVYRWERFHKYFA